MVISFAVARLVMKWISPLLPNNIYLNTAYLAVSWWHRRSRSRNGWWFPLLWPDSWWSEYHLCYPALSRWRHRSWLAPLMPLPLFHFRRGLKALVTMYFFKNKNWFVNSQIIIHNQLNFMKSNIHREIRCIMQESNFTDRYMIKINRINERKTSENQFRIEPTESIS